jgi:endonuclease/exonuclease/phosphatase family metal-dependent hydrolase
MVRPALFAAFAACLPSFAADQPVRIASLNLDKRSGPELVAKLSAEPDLRKANIVLLQEVVDSPRFHLAEQIAKSLGMRFAFAKAFTLEGETDEGLAILSRYAISGHRSVRLARNQLHFKNRIRIALLGDIVMPWGRTQVICIHQDNRINQEEKVRQLDDLWPAIAAKGPAILGGDFNTGDFYWISHFVPIPQAQHQREAVIEDARRHGFVTNLGAGPATYHIPGQKIDWIFARDLKLLDSGVTPIHFSDHNSVWITVQPR